MLDGAWKFYSDKGILTAEYNYTSGKKNGSQKEFYTDGKQKSEEILKDEIKSGLCKYFNEAGVLIRSVPYDNGMENGIVKVNYQDFKQGVATKEVLS